MSKLAKNPHYALSILCTLITALAGGCIFNLLHLPLPWLLGPMIAVLIGSNLRKPLYSWPPQIRNTGMIIVGYTTGLSLTGSPRCRLRQLLTLSLAIGSGVLLIVGAYSLSLLFAYLEQVTAATALLSLAPGGMDQMSLIAQETGANLPTVAGYQLFRTFFIFFAVPPLFKMIFHRKRPGIGNRNES